MKTFQGKVISTKTAKTAVVEIISRIKHPFYKKIILKMNKFKAHFDENLKVALGDTVLIAETRPISKTKHFIVIKIISKGKE